MYKMHSLNSNDHFKEKNNWPIGFVLTMNRMHLAVVLVAVVVSLSARQAWTQSGCTSAILSLAPCLGYTTGASSAPSSACCTQLASVVQQQPQCLCTLLNGPAPLGISVNKTLALALPIACNVKTPPASDCNAVTGGPPSSSPTPPTTSTPIADGQSGNGSKTTGGQASGSAAIVNWSTAVMTLFSLLTVMFIFEM